MMRSGFVGADSCSCLDKCLLGFVQVVFLFFSPRLVGSNAPFVFIFVIFFFPDGAGREQRALSPWRLVTYIGKEQLYFLLDNDRKRRILQCICLSIFVLHIAYRYRIYCKLSGDIPPPG